MKLYLMKDLLLQLTSSTSPAGNLAPLTRAITALWRLLDRPVRSPTPQGPKGSVQGPGMPPPAASGDTMYKRGLSFLEGCDWPPVWAVIAALEPRMIDDGEGKAERWQHKAP
eukprot:superscaffoldBa00005537_g20467